MNGVRRIREWMVEMATCREVGRMLQSYLDGRLDPPKVAKVSAHLEHCLRCGLEIRAYGEIKEALSRVSREGEVHPEDRLAIERLRRFAGEIENEEESG